MPSRLERHYDTLSSQFITCSCYRRRPLLADDRMKNIFLKVLEETRKRYGFCVYGYVLMPEHFHLLISNPEVGNTGKVLQVLKRRVSHQALPPGLNPRANLGYFSFPTVPNSLALALATAIHLKQGTGFVSLPVRAHSAAHTSVFENLRSRQSHRTPAAIVPDSESEHSAKIMPGSPPSSSRPIFSMGAR